jgi:hypothetical protein
MIYEYALQPRLLTQWAGNDRDYAEFLREYGLGSPRIITSFPKQSASRLRRYLLREGPTNLQSRQAQRYLEMITKILESLVFRDGFECRSADWVENVTTENERASFDVVLAEAGVDIDRCLSPENMYMQESVWNHSRQKDISRTHTDLNASLKNLLRLSKDKVVIIDTFGWNSRAIATIQSLVGEIYTDRVHSEIPDVLLYYKEKIDRNRASNSSPSATIVKTQILRGLPHGQSQINLGVYELKDIDGKDIFHNRCILTEHGGVSLGHGIDLTNDQNHTDEIHLMEKEIYLKYWDQFVDNNCFRITTQS